MATSNLYLRLFRERKTPLLRDSPPMDRHRELVIGPVGITTVFGTIHLHGPAVNSGPFLELGTTHDLIQFGARYFSDSEIHTKEDLEHLPKHDLLDFEAASRLKLDALDGIALCTFMSELVRNTSYSSEKLGLYDNTMVLKRDDEKGRGYIEWTADTVVGVGDNEPIYEEIGITFDEHRVLLDYDGVFSLPKQAITLLRFAGIEVPEDME